jgi:hypothetical protein
MKDSLGDKFKAAERYHETHIRDRGGYLIVRLDGKAFHTFTRGCVKPFDDALTTAFDHAVYGMCRESDIPIKFAYTQSDEVSLLIDNRDIEPWFGGKIQKIVSVTASTLTAYFNAYYDKRKPKPAIFDSRVFQLFEDEDVHDYFLWRKKDANRNAVSMLAQSLYSHKSLQGIGTHLLVEQIQRDYPETLPINSRFYNGAHFHSEVVDMPVEFLDKRTQQIETTMAKRRVWHRETEHMLDNLEGALVR